MADIGFDVVIVGPKELVDRLSVWPTLPVPAVIDDAVLAEVFDQQRDGLAIDVLMDVHKVDLERAVCQKFLDARGVIEKPVRLTQEDFRS